MEGGLSLILPYATLQFSIHEGQLHSTTLPAFVSLTDKSDALPTLYAPSGETIGMIGIISTIDALWKKYISIISLLIEGCRQVSEIFGTEKKIFLITCL